MMITRQDVIDIANEVELDDSIWIDEPDCKHIDDLVKFAKLVAKHTLMNSDPSSFMSYQEGFEVGAAKERQACAEIAEKQRYAMNISLTSHPAQNGTAVGILNQIRARGQE